MVFWVVETLGSGFLFKKWIEGSAKTMSETVKMEHS